MSTHNVVWLAPEQLAEIKSAYATQTIDPFLVSVEHAAILLDCSTDTIDKLIEDGTLQAQYLRRLKRIRMASLKKFAGVKR